MEEAAASPAGLSRLDIGVIIVLVAMGVAGIVGLIAVFDAGSDVTAFGTGFGAALLIFQAGATIACALACLARRRFEALSIGAPLLAGILASVLIISVGGAASIADVQTGITSIADESLLRPLAAVLVVLASLWFAALATSRVDRSPQP